MLKNRILQNQSWEIQKPIDSRDYVTEPISSPRRPLNRQKGDKHNREVVPLVAFSRQKLSVTALKSRVSWKVTHLRQFCLSAYGQNAAKTRPVGWPKTLKAKMAWALKLNCCDWEPPCLLRVGTVSWNEIKTIHGFQESAWRWCVFCLENIGSWESMRSHRRILWDVQDV